MKTKLVAQFLSIVVLAPMAGCTPRSTRVALEVHASSSLLSRFESVVYSKPALISEASGLPRNAKVLRSPYRLFFGALESIGDDSSGKLLRTADAILVGSKDYRPPAGLGPVRSQVCYVVVLRDGMGFDLRTYFSQPPLKNERDLVIWNWSAGLGEFGELDSRKSSLYATQVDRTYLVVSNTLEELRAVALDLSRNRSPGTALAIRDWENLSQRDFWGYRRYRHTGIVDREAAGMSDIGSGAEAFSFSFDKTTNSFTLRFFCQPGEESTAAKVNSRALFGRLKPMGGGVWERVVPITGDLEGLERLVFAMHLLGFGEYV